MTEEDKNDLQIIKRLLQERLSKTKGRSVIFYYDESQSISLFKDQLGLKKLLDVLQTGSGKKILWQEKKDLRGMGRSTSVAADPFAPLPVAEVAVGVEIRVEDPTKIDEYFKKVLATKNTADGGTVNHIEIYNPEDGSKALVFINENYYSPLEVTIKEEEGYWRRLWKIAENKITDCDNETEAKNAADYFNTNRNCPIYSNFSFQLTKILDQSNEALKSAKGVRIEKITLKAVNTRKNLKST